MLFNTENPYRRSSQIGRTKICRNDRVEGSERKRSSSPEYRVHFCPAYLATPAIWVLCVEEHGALETLMRTRNLRALSIGWLLPIAHGRPRKPQTATATRQTFHLPLTLLFPIAPSPIWPFSYLRNPKAGKSIVLLFVSASDWRISQWP